MFSDPCGMLATEMRPWRPKKPRTLRIVGGFINWSTTAIAVWCAWGGEYGLMVWNTALAIHFFAMDDDFKPAWLQMWRLHNDVAAQLRLLDTFER